MDPAAQVTRLLLDLKNGDPAAVDRLIPSSTTSSAAWPRTTCATSTRPPPFNPPRSYTRRI